MPADFAQRFMVRLLADFAQRYPEVQLELDLSARRVDLIAEGFDLAIRMGQLGEDSQLAARRLGSFRMGLYASPDFIARHGEPMLPEGLLDMHALMLLSRTGEAVPWQMTRGEGANAQSWSGAPATRTLANSPSVLTQLALAGVGIAAIDEFFAGEAVEAAQLQPLLADWALPASPCWAVFPERRLMPLRTRVFLDALSRSLCPGAHAHPDHQQASHP
jgi:DNA-binding transcriptional LysR family regulator